MPGTTDGTVGHGVLAAAISNGIVGLMHRYTGRGPVRARTTIDENLVVCVLGDALTKAEQQLVEAGREKVVLRGRRAIQSALAEDAIQMVEELTEREVVAFMSNNHIDPDLGVEIFLLAPIATP
jgi:uncharacterized protein YbcI